MAQIISVTLLGISLFAATIFAAGNQINWFGFSSAAFAMIVSVFWSRIITNKKIKSETENSKSTSTFSNDLKNVKALCVLYSTELSEENRFDIEEKFIEVLPDIEERRIALINEFGLPKYTEVISTYAKAERKINRGVSAAIDGFINEAKKYFNEAIQIIIQSQELLKG
jgi:hypothetical protein